MVSVATLDYTQPLANTYGAFFIGLLVSALLHGVCLTQAIQYFQRYPKDRWFLKAAVAITILVDTIHLILTTVGVWYYLIKHFHEPEYLEYLTWPINIQALLVGVNTCVVQVFFVYRIWKMSKGNYIMCGIISLLIVGEAAAGLSMVIFIMRMDTWEQFLATKPVVISIDILSCTTDVLIAGSLVRLLHRARTGFKESDTLINKLIIFVINTGIITTIFAFCALISVIASPETMFYSGFYFCVGHLYTNSLLATLNARKAMAQTSINDDIELKESSLTTRSRGTVQNLDFGHAYSRSINIRVDTTVDAMRDSTLASTHKADHSAVNGRAYMGEDESSVVILKKGHLSGGTFERDC